MILGACLAPGLVRDGRFAAVPADSEFLGRPSGGLFILRWSLPGAFGFPLRFRRLLGLCRRVFPCCSGFRLPPGLGPPGFREPSPVAGFQQGRGRWGPVRRVILAVEPAGQRDAEGESCPSIARFGGLQLILRRAASLARDSRGIAVPALSKLLGLFPPFPYVTTAIVLSVLQLPFL